MTAVEFVNKKRWMRNCSIHSGNLVVLTQIVSQHQWLKM